MSIISTVLGIVSWVVGILVLIKLFQREGVLKGILGIICMLYTFIWGWMHVKDENISTLMYIWTAVIVVSIVVSGIIAATAGTGGEGVFLPGLAV